MGLVGMDQKRVARSIKIIAVNHSIGEGGWGVTIHSLNQSPCYKIDEQMRNYAPNPFGSINR